MCVAKMLAECLVMRELDTEEGSARLVVYSDGEKMMCGRRVGREG